MNKIKGWTHFDTVACTLLVLLGSIHVWIWLGPFEDAYITFRYVRNLLEGYGFAFNPGERVEGFTSFGWVMVLAALGALHAPYAILATVLSVLFGLGLLPLTYVAALRTYGQTRWEAVGATAAVAANGTWAYYAGTGMETTLFTLLVTLGVLWLFTKAKRCTFGAAALLAAASLVRPEGIGYAALLTAALAVNRQSARDAIRFSGLYAVLFLPYYAWRFVYFGAALPNTYYAKASFSPNLVLAGFVHLERYATPYLVWLAPVALLIIARVHRNGRIPWVVAAVIGGALLNDVIVGGDTFAFCRFLLPATPWLAIVTLAGARVLLNRWLRRGNRSGLGWLLAAVLVTWTALVAYLPRFSATGVHGRSMAVIVEGLYGINQKYFQVGRWLGQRFGPDTTIALNAAGIVPYVSGLRTIDMLGLNDVHIAHTPHMLGSGMHGHEKYDVDYVLRRRPELILPGLPIPTRRLLSASEAQARFHGWAKYMPGDAVLLASEIFHQRYHAIQFIIAGGQHLIIFVRNDFDYRKSEKTSEDGNRTIREPI